jgi:hypothetical protein
VTHQPQWMAMMAGPRCSVGRNLDDQPWLDLNQ